jgi:D-sedoheptulose 7-phosphate isomerase
MTDEKYVSTINSHLDKAAKVILSSKTHTLDIQNAAILISKAIYQGNKVMWCGNGGSAADSQHLAAELVGRYKMNRPGLSSIALTTDTSVITAIANDFGFEHVFERQVFAIGKPGDVLVCLTTSGKSKSILNALSKARDKEITTILISSTRAATVSADIRILVDSDEVEQIQHAHIAIGHVICEIIEIELFGT